MDAPIIIVGAGQAGLQTAESLRSEGYAGPLLLLGDEPRGPYHRPPLSKSYLLGESSEAQLSLRAPEALARKGIELRTGVRVEALNRAAKTLRVDGQPLAYAGLCLATGSRPRPLPVAGADLPGVFPLRTLADTQAIAARLAQAQQVVVVGGGFIGLEFAAVACKLGKAVTVLEAAPRLMARAVTPMLSEIYLALHRAQGVSVALDTQLAEIVGDSGGVKAVRTADGRQWPADLVLVGIGILPNQELAAEAGLECQGGIVVDACARTADPAIVAAGDCTAVRLADGSLRRLESVQNAVEQGKSAAAALLGKARPFTAAPWFWSDQFEVKLQIVGVATGHDQAVVRGDLAAHRGSIFYFTGPRLLAIDSLNQPGDHMVGRKLLERGVSPTPAQAADGDFALNSLLS